MLRADNIVYLCMYINISCISKNNKALRLKFGQQLLGLALRVSPWLWHWALDLEQKVNLVGLWMFTLVQETSYKAYKVHLSCFWCKMSGHFDNCNVLFLNFSKPCVEQDLSGDFENFHALSYNGLVQFSSFDISILC